MTAEDVRTDGEYGMPYEPKPVFTGLCIEGPLAGQFKASEHPFFRVTEYPPVDIGAPRDPVPHPDRMSATVTVKYHTYKHIIGFRHRKNGQWTEDVLNFWVPSDKDWTPLDCVRKMAEDYADYHDLRNS